MRRHHSHQAWYCQWWANWLYPVIAVWVIIAYYCNNKPWLYHWAVNYRNSVITIVTYAWLHINLTDAWNNAVIGIICATIMTLLLRQHHSGLFSNIMPLVIWLAGGLIGGISCYLVTGIAHTMHAVIGASIGLTALIGFTCLCSIREAIARAWQRQVCWGRVITVNVILLYMIAASLIVANKLTFAVHLLGLFLGVIFVIIMWLDGYYRHTQHDHLLD